MLWSQVGRSIDTNNGLHTLRNGPCLMYSLLQVGHMFQLDTRYSETLQALYSGPGGKGPLVMGSYGLGLTRILAAGLEALSLPDQLRWPPLLAPYTLVIITPKVLQYSSICFDRQ